MVYVRPSILFVDDDINILNALRRSMHSCVSRWDIEYETDPRKAIVQLRASPSRVVISDLDMPSLNGLEMIENMRSFSPETTYILLTGTGDFTSALEAINSSEIFRFYTKPCPTDRLINAIEEAMQEPDAPLEANQRHGIADRSKDLTRMNLARSALELIAPSVLVLEPNGRLIYANKSAGKLLMDNDGILIDASDICRGSSVRETKYLHEAITELSSNAAAQPMFMTLPRPSMKRDLSLVLIPLDETTARGKNMVAVMITDLEISTAPDPTSLVKIFKLTHSEAKIAQSIAQGEGLEKAASACGITLSSARTYLKRIYSKTGARGQAELVKLILSSSAALVKEAY